MPNINDVFRVRLFGLCGSVECMSILHYKFVQSGGVGFDITDLSDIIRTQLISPMEVIMSSSASINGVEIQNLNTISEYTNLLYVPTPVGDVIADSLPAWVTWSFTKVRPYPPLKSGSFRLWGVPETYQAAGIVQGAGVTGQQLVADALETNLIDAQNNIYAPVVKRYNPITLPAIQDWPITVVRPEGLGSQNTRKS